MKFLKKLITEKLPFVILGVILAVAGTAYAINITVPSAPGTGYTLVSTSTGAYISTTTSPYYLGAVLATSTTISNQFGSTTTVPALQVGSTAIGSNVLKLSTRTGLTVSNSESVGGVFNMNLSTTDSLGMALYNNHTGTNRLLSLVCDAATFAGNCFHVRSDGTESAFNILGASVGKGVGKLSHATVGDADASILSLDATSAGYLGQGIFIDCTGGSCDPTNKSLSIANHAGTNNIFSVLWNGLVTMNYSSSTIYSPFITASTTNLNIGGDSLNNLEGDGLVVTSNALLFDCSDVASTGLQCSGEDLQLNATGDWTGTLDSLEAASFLRSDASDSYTSGTLTFDAATSLDLNTTGLSIADTAIAFDGASTEFTFTGNHTINTDDLTILKTSGNVGIGTTTPGYPLTSFSATVPQLSLSNGAGVPEWIARNAGGNLYLATSTGAATTSANSIGFSAGSSASSGLLIGTSTAGSTGLAVNGTVYWWGLTSNTGASTASLCLSSTNQMTTNTDAETCIASSERWKKNIEKLDLGLAEILKLKPVSFEYKTEGGEHYGLIAEDVSEIDPLLASYDEEGLPSGIRWSHITSLLVNSVQQMWGEITNLIDWNKDQEARIKNLENENAELKARLENLESKFR